MSEARYVYLDDTRTDPTLTGQPCDPVRRADGRCVVSQRGHALVIFEDGRRVNVLRRRLRICGKEGRDDTAPPPPRRSNERLPR